MITMHDDTPTVAPATPTTTLGWAWPDAVLGFLGVHLGLRAEAAVVADLVERGELRAAARRARLLARVLGEHHRVEDEILWPALEARRPGFADARLDLELQHVQLDAALDDLVHDARTIDRLIPLLSDHLQAEEQLALPVWLATFTPDDHAMFEHQLRRSTPVRHIATMLSWLFDVTPHDVRPLATSRVPTGLRWAHHVVFRHLYSARYGRHAQLCPA
ncbi:MAG: hemerythrin domain-containing protein [Ilumatobacteraceae bacterium]